jgi:hypothetical protein
MTLSVPEPQSTDPEDLSTALETAAIFSAQGDVREAVRWVRRAAELAGDAGDDVRALTLARAVADLGASVAPSAPPPEVAPSAPAPAAAPSAATAPALDGAPAADLPPPPPLPPREVMATGDRITNPGIAPPSTPPAASATQAEVEPEVATAPEQAAASRPASIPPPTAREDARWSEPDTEPETPRPTNGAGGAHAALVTEDPALAPVPQASPAPAEDAPASPAATPLAAPAAIPLQHQTVRARVEPTTETGVFRLTLLSLGETVGDDAHEALLVLLDPAARLEA